MPEVPQFIVERARANAGLFTADEVAAWPAGLLEELVSAGVLSPDKPAPTIACDACGDDHVESVEYIQSPPAAGLRAYIPCPRNGRVLVPLERLRRWSINMTMIPREPSVGSASQAGRQLPHALSVAHADLIGVLKEAEDLYRQTMRFPNPAPVLDAIERFVHELELDQGCRDELRRRSSLVEGRCQPGSDYAKSRQHALKAHTATPTVLCSAKLALERLRSPNLEHPRFLQELIDVRKSVERLLADDTAGLSSEADAAFRAWRKTCREIQLEAERLHVDGCWYLEQVFQAAGPNPSDRAVGARAILQTTMGGANLDKLRLAADSLIARHSENGGAKSQEGPPPSVAVVDEPLNERSQHVLVAMLEMGACDSDHRKTTAEIAVKAFGRGTDANALKTVMAELNDRTFIETKLGRNGGGWLTDKGRTRAEKLRPT